MQLVKKSQSKYEINTILIKAYVQFRLETLWGC